jgi:hypothetical protein
MVPLAEIDDFVTTVVRAVEMAESGRLADGYTEILHGLEQARLARAWNGAWAERIIWYWRNALDRYCNHYGVKAG